MGEVSGKEKGGFYLAGAPDYIVFHWHFQRKQRVRAHLFFFLLLLFSAFLTHKSCSREMSVARQCYDGAVHAVTEFSGGKVARLGDCRQTGKLEAHDD